MSISFPSTGLSVSCFKARYGFGGFNWHLSLLLSLLLVLHVNHALALPENAEAPPEATPIVTPAQRTFFKEKVKPILDEYCFECHGQKKEKAGLNLMSRERILQGGDIGPAIDLKNPKASLLLEVINYASGDEDLDMPPKNKMPQAKIDLITKWIMDGAHWDTEVKGKVELRRAKPGEHTQERIEAGKSWWAYQPVKAPAIPDVKQREAVKSPIDALLLSRLEAKGLKMNGLATREVLVRRAYYDLIGLPPSPAEIKAFVDDKSPDAFEKVIDDLLSRPQYGERWGRHWLDLVRFAETNGYERDAAKPYAWRYRDYVIDSFNQDKPYDRFIKEQLAGDELPDRDLASHIATGYLRLSIWDDEPADRELHRYEVLDSLLSTTTSAVLGTSLGCARCHEHKGDPVDQRDYYSMLAFFQNVSNMSKKPLINFTQGDDAGYQKKLAAWEAKVARLHGELSHLREDFESAAANSSLADKLLPSSDLKNLKYRFFRSTWKKIPDFDNIRYEDSGTLPANLVSLYPATRAHSIGFVYDGKLVVPADGEYRFKYLSGESGLMRLKLNGEVIIDQAKPSKRPVVIKRKLSKGVAAFRLEMIHQEKGLPELTMYWQGPGMREPRYLTATQFGAKSKSGNQVLLPTAETEKVNWYYTFAQPGRPWYTTDYKVPLAENKKAKLIKEKRWLQGKAGFGTKGTPNSRVGTTWKSKAIWMRTTFDVDKIPASLKLRIHHDEDAAVYLNGVEIFSGKGFLSQYKEVPINSDLLSIGENLVAVHCKQTRGGQYIDVGLLAEGGQAGGAMDFKTAIRKFGTQLIGKEKTNRYLEKSKQQSRLLQQKPVPGQVPIMAVWDTGNRKTHILARGNPGLVGEEVAPNFIRVLDPPSPEIAAPDGKQFFPSTGRRLALANWLVSKKNPLTARVLANRLWQFHFGRPIVGTPNDFGKFGLPPTHPEILDWLAVQIMDGGWKLKAIHKKMMLSHAYQMASSDQPDALKVDAGNTLYWRYNMRRLSAEEVRDSILKLTGQLNLKMGGPSIYTKVPRAVLETASRPDRAWGKSSPEDQNRRSVYIFVKRSLIEPILASFDFADTDQSCPERFATTVPTQALSTLNSAFFNDSAQVLADRLKKEAGADRKAQVSLALKLALNREPKAEEIKRGERLIEELIKKEQATEAQAMRYFCLVILNLNEFIYLD